MPTGLTDILKYAIPGAALGSNIYGGIEQGELSGAQKAALENALSYMQNPAKFQQLINSNLASLWGSESGAITPAVTRSVDATLGSSGLAESPNQVAYAVSQGLAPYITSLGNTAETEAGQTAFGGTTGIGSPNFSGSNFSQLFSMYPQLAKMLGINQTPTSSTVPNPASTSVPTLDPGFTGTFDPNLTPYLGD